MKKRYLALCLALLLGCTAIPATAAVEESRLFSEAYYYTATLYYCDSARNKVVLKNVKPSGFATTEKRRTALDATYQEIPFSGTGRLKDGTAVLLEELNYYADCNVGVVITRNKAEGIRVVALQLQ